VERDVERLVEALVRLEVVPVEQPRDEDEVARGRDRQQLGQALDEAEDERLPVREAPGPLPHAGGGQSDGDEQERRRGRIDEAGGEAPLARHGRNGVLGHGARG
jgi:hypothetical protein